MATMLMGQVSQFGTLAVERLGQRLGKVTTEELAQVVEGADEIIGALPGAVDWVAERILRQ